MQNKDEFQLLIKFSQSNAKTNLKKPYKLKKSTKQREVKLREHRSLQQTHGFW